MTAWDLLAQERSLSMQTNMEIEDLILNSYGITATVKWRIRQSVDATSRLGCPRVSPTQKPCQSPAYQVSYKKLMDAAWDVIEKSAKM